MASFAAAPRPEQVARLNDAGIVTIVTVGAKRHTEKVAAMGVKAVIAQGGEGGGHTGSVPTSLLLPQVVDGVAGADVVVLGAGGFFDGRGLATVALTGPTASPWAPGSCSPLRATCPITSRPSTWGPLSPARSSPPLWTERPSG